MSASGNSWSSIMVWKPHVTAAVIVERDGKFFLDGVYHWRCPLEPVTHYA